MALVMRTMGPMVILFIIYPISVLPLRILTTRTTMFTRMPRMCTDGRDMIARAFHRMRKTFGRIGQAISGRSFRREKEAKEISWTIPC